jgi:butyrate kinase
MPGVILGGVLVYVLNPGSTSTKLGLATVAPAATGGVSATIERIEIKHPELRSTSQDARGRSGLDPAALDAIREAVREATRAWPKPDAIAVRGGLIGPLAAGTYRVTPELAQFSLDCPYGPHASNAGAPLGLEWGGELNVPTFIVDPPTVDEMLPEARVSGVPGVDRRARFHALNARAVARRAAREIGKRFDDAAIVVAHLGGGSSVTRIEKGRAIDTSGGLLDEGPFSPQRAGIVPTAGLLDLAYSTDRASLEHRLTLESGFSGLLGTADLREIESREADDAQVQLVVNAYILQVAKAVGAYAAVAGRPDAIALTGGVVRWTKLAERLERRLAWIAPVILIPGELELEALAEGVGRVLLGIEEAREWRPSGVTRQETGVNADG